MREAALGTDGMVAVTDGEGVLGFGGGLGVAREEAREEAVGLRGEGVDGEAPAQALSELEGLLTEQGAADGPGYLEGAVT